MRWRGGRESQNVEDRRGVRAGPVASVGLGTLVLAFAGYALFGINPLVLLTGLSQLGGGGGDSAPVEQSGRPYQGTAQEEELKKFISVVLADTEDAWKAMFRSTGGQYRDPKLVLYSGLTRSACGMGQAAMGPFYCPSDQTVYLDLSFYDEMRKKFGAPGDFAQAYVIAHEIGHHVQTLLGISEKVHRAQARASQEEGNQIQVRMELQADCLAGVWGNHADRARGILEAGDIEEALNAAAAIGDDRLQKQTQGRVVPESFTHGTSDQRARWFRRGLQSGSLDSCDTFSTASL
jgi:predicted metalloprotease